MKPTCETCRWYASNKQDAGEIGECRRYAPRPVLWHTIQLEDETRGETQACWPMTMHNDFCGEHEPQFALDERTNVNDT